jgi:predicted lipoprotein with Yx(FWY)xxD motif
MPLGWPATTLFSVKNRRIRKERFSMKHKRSITVLAGGAALLLAVLTAAGCGGSGKSSGSSGPPRTASGGTATVGVSNEGLGNILVDSQGRTLYLFNRDTGTMSECSGACAVNWPPLAATGKPTVGSGADASLVSTSARAGGHQQVTYNGHPLYLFKGDSKPGDTNGEGLNAFGGSWYALSPAGNEIHGQTPSSGGGYGY